jgi:hypothetical protein
MTDRLALASRFAPIALIALLAVALLLGPGVGEWNREGPDADRAASLLRRIDALPPGALGLVGFDPDLATYAEVRPAARAVLTALERARARVAVVSFTPEGRALASAELDRIGTSALDLGFVPGGEAGLVTATRSLVPPDADGPVAEAAIEAGGGVAAFDLAIVVGGGDIGPRSWVEQVAPRAPGLPIAAIVPGVQRPQLEPYLVSGQLAELIAGPRAVAAAAGDDETLERAAGAVVLGLFVAIGLLLAAALWPHVAPRRAAVEPEEGR